MNARSILSAALVAILSMGTVELSAQERSTKPDYDKTDREKSEVRGQARAGYDEKGKMAKFHRASKLIGMNVKNQQNESLGEIEDLVVDLESGRISYAVLATGGVLGIGEKYIAIPTSVFEHSADGDKLMLNADKSKIEQAPSFTKDNWPDVESPAWGAFWGTARTERGGIGERGRATGESFHGKIVAINPQARTMTVQGDLGTQVFSIDRTAAVNLKGTPNAQLSDLKVGDHVFVEFRKQGEGNAIAYSVRKGDKGDLEERK